jgi:hypothetical protein
MEVYVVVDERPSTWGELAKVRVYSTRPPAMEDCKRRRRFVGDADDAKLVNVRKVRVHDKLVELPKRRKKEAVNVDSKHGQTVQGKR